MKRDLDLGHTMRGRRISGEFKFAEQKYFEALLLDHFNEGQVLGSGKRFTGQMIDRLLVFGHTHDVAYIGNQH